MSKKYIKSVIKSGWINSALTFAFLLCLIIPSITSASLALVNTKKVSVKNSPVTLYQTPAPISDQTLINTLTKILTNNKDLQAKLKGEKGDKGDQGQQGVSAPSQFNFGQTLPYQPYPSASSGPSAPVSSQYSSGPIGILGGFASLGAQDITTNTINVTSNSTFNNITVSGGTTIAGNLSVSGTITGSAYNPSFTLGSIPFQDSFGFTQNNSNFFWDNANNRLGIGNSNPSSRLDITTNSLGITQTNTSGLSLVNTTPATVGVQQISPAIRWTGQGWKTNATATSQAVEFQAYVLPVQGTANPTGVWKLQSSIDGGAYSDIFTVTSSGAVVSAGSLTVTGGLAANGGILAGVSGYGTSGQVLKSNGGGITPTWVDVNTLVTALTNGNGTTINGTQVDLGGTLSNDVFIDTTSYIFKVYDSSYYSGLYINDNQVSIGGMQEGGQETKLVILNDSATGYFNDKNNLALFGINIIDPSVALDVVGDIEYTGTISNVSDERLKENINPISNNLEKLRQINPVSYNLIGDTRLRYGFTAQNIQTIFPSAVSVVDKKNGYLGLDYVQLISPAISAIQELDIKVNNLYSLDINKGDTLGYLIKKYLEDALNGLEKIFVKEVRTEKLCVGNTCVTESELIELLQRNNLNQSTNSAPTDENNVNSEDLMNSISEDENNDSASGEIENSNFEDSNPSSEEIISEKLPEAIPEVTIIEVLEGGPTPILSE